MKPFYLTLFCTICILTFSGTINAAENTGERLFLENCAECHQPDGNGIPEIYPALAGNELVLGSGVDVALVLIIGRGEMPSFDGAITSEDMAAIINYVRNSFGNQGGLITANVIDSLK
ncbi:MAG: c-type cytochrome [Pseudomonadales bacterium]|nr:c-type cytochrome [Pseudomonadales bacterium]